MSAEIEAIRQRLLTTENRIRPRRAACSQTCHLAAGIWVIWRYDREDEQVPDVFGEVDEASVFVITAY